MWTSTPHHRPFTWPHTPCTNHTSYFPSVPLLPDYTPLDCSPPAIWQCQAPHLRSHFPSFTLCPSIESVSTPSVFAAWPAGVNGTTACQVHAVFINTPDSLSLLCLSLAVGKGPFSSWRKLTASADRLFSYLLIQEFCFSTFLQSFLKLLYVL